MPDDGPTDEELEVEINLRPAREVAERLLVLGAVCRRTFLETRPEDVADDDPEAERFDLAAWLRAEGLEEVATTSERRLLTTRIGRLDAEDAAAASWQTEGLVALGWALGLIEALPPYDRAADPTPLLASLPAPWDATTAFCQAAGLRDESAIAAERERAEVWQWRAETAELLDGATGRERRDLLAAVREVAHDAVAAGVLAAVAGDDFPARNRPYRDLDPTARDEAAAVAGERLRALNWLCGFGASWDDVPTEL